MKPSEIVKPTQPSGVAQALTPSSFGWGIVTIILVATFLFLWRLGNASLRDWDEATYAQISKEMVNSGNWLVPHLEDEPWFDKPPLYMWATGVLFQSFGISEFWSRAVSALSAIWLLILVYLIGKLVYSQVVGLLSPLVLLTSFQFVRFARSCMLDMTLTLFVFLAIYGYLRVKRNGPKWWYVIWISFALGLMVKTAAAAVIPLTITLALLFDNKVGASVRTPCFWRGFLASIAIITPWHLFMYAQFHEAFLEQYFGYRVLLRATTVLEGNTGDVLFYMRTLRDQFSPWFYLSAFAVFLGLQESLVGQPKSRIIVILPLVVGGLYTAVQTKLPWYILPAYPSLAILIANLIVRAFHEVRSIALGGLMLGTVGLVILNVSGTILIVAAICVVALGLIFLGQSLYRSAVLSICLFLFIIGIREVRPLYLLGKEPVAQLAQLASDFYPNDREPLILYSGIYAPTARFYSNRLVKPVEKQSDLTILLSDQQTKRILIAKKDIESLSYDYEIHILAESGPIVYATIRQISSR